MTDQMPRSSRTWQVVVAATAITVIGGASTAGAWTGDGTSAADGSTLELSEQRPIADTGDQATLRVADAMSARWDALAGQVSAWTPSAVPAVGSAFAAARDLVAAQDVQSASVPSVASPVSPQSPVTPESQASPVSPQTPPSAQSPVTPESPVTPPSVQSPVTPESPQSPPSVPSPESPQSPESPESPDSDDD